MGHFRPSAETIPFIVQTLAEEYIIGMVKISIISEGGTFWCWLKIAVITLFGATGDLMEALLRFSSSTKGLLSRPLCPPRNFSSRLQ